MPIIQVGELDEGYQLRMLLYLYEFWKYNKIRELSLKYMIFYVSQIIYLRLFYNPHALVRQV